MKTEMMYLECGLVCTCVSRLFPGCKEKKQHSCIRGNLNIVEGSKKYAPGKALLYLN